MKEIDKSQFPKSKVWKIQREYFEQKGVDAWGSGEVPHYVTSNPVVGKTYAELVLALLKDLAIKGQQTQTVYIIELGAGHGRLCYHFFKYFEKYYGNSAISLPPICYVLSDFTAANLEFWKMHPRFQPYIDKGWLDFTLFDAETDAELKLTHSGKIITAESLAQPLVVIANYFFDTIPQELFKIANGNVEQAILSTFSDLEYKAASPAELIDSLRLEYSYEELNLPVYQGEPELNKLLDFYQQQFSDTHLLLPHVGIRCLERLRALSNAGMVLLSADKGDHHVSNLDYLPAPQLTKHGSFSLSVNYHALKLYCENQNGEALFSRHQHHHVDIGCLLFLNEANSYVETINAYDRYVQDFGPDDYFSIKKLIETSFGDLTYRDITSVTRLSGYDTRIFQQMLPDLYEQIDSLDSNERWSLFLFIPRIWDTYFPLKEAEDFACNLGDLLLRLQFYEEAILYYQKSLLIYGDTESVCFNIALCYCLLGNTKAAMPYVTKLLDSNSDNNKLNQLIADFSLNISSNTVEVCE